LDFLGRRPFRRKNVDYAGWICLDFLGFSRPNLDLSMGYTGKTAEIFSLGFLPSVSRAAGCARGFNMGKCWITHEASLPHFCFSAINCRPSRFLSGL
jgi:hypothetical protein